MSFTSNTVNNSPENSSETAARGLELADPKLLDKIDQLFELNIGEHVALPQVKSFCVQESCSGKLTNTIHSC